MRGIGSLSPGVGGIPGNRMTGRLALLILKLGCMSVSSLFCGVLRGDRVHPWTSYKCIACSCAQTWLRPSSGVVESLLESFALVAAWALVLVLSFVVGIGHQDRTVWCSGVGSAGVVCQVW